MKIKYLATIAGLLLIFTTVFAEAPVYDADGMPPQFEAENDQGEFAPPSDDTTFVPMRPQASRQGSLEIEPGPSPEAGAAAEAGPEGRLKRLEQQLSNLQNSEAIAKSDSLQSQVQALREQVEQLVHQLKSIQEQQKSFYADIEKRLAQQGQAKPMLVNAEQPEKAKATSAKKPLIAKLFGSSDDTPAKSENQPNVAEEQQIYQTAYTLIKGKKYNEAVSVLQNMLQKYPSGQFASNAHYWLGELYGLLGKNKEALNEFDMVIKNYPDSPRISDAQLKVGLIYASDSKWPQAKLAFKKVINHYPGTTSSRLAQEQLKQIKQSGH